MPELVATTLICRVGDLLATDVDGEMVLMNLERGFYYGLAGTARAIWDMLETPLHLEQLCSLLESKYAGPHEVIEADVRKFVAELSAETIVTLS